jgi:hypothetical protein
MSGFTKEYHRAREKDVFPTPEELAMNATQLGITPEEFVKRYHANIRQAKLWNTCQSFIGVVKSIRVEEVKGEFLTAFMVYEVNSGKEDAKQSEIRVGIIHKTDKTQPNNILCAKIKRNVDKKVIIYKGVLEKESGEYVILLDIDELS